jgi:outer membrane protein assembly factor BamB
MKQMTAGCRLVIRAGLVAALVLPAFVSTAAAQDWTQWRGPNRDGVAEAFDVPASWPDGLRQRWSVEVGSGYATPLLIVERLYLYVRQAEDEVMLALDPANGETIWRSAYPAPYEMNPATNPHGPGPKSTPAHADGRLFTLGMSGIVSAFAADDGELLWQVPGRNVEPLYHTAMSPVVDGDLVVFQVGGHDDGALTAFDTASGAVRWSMDGGTAPTDPRSCSISRGFGRSWRTRRPTWSA